MEKETEKKQLYLRENILSKGYSAEEFMSFLSSKKGEKGLDLANWSLIELGSTVAEFIQLKERNENKKKLEKNSDNNDNQIQENEIVITTKDEEEYLNSQLQLITEPEFILCNLSESTEITEATGVQIKLSSPEKVDGGIFGKSYINYLLETSPLGYKVRKRYSDFEWLRNELSLQYIGSVIPPLCKKNYNDRFSESLVSKRTRLLQKFIEGILVHPLMRNSQMFYDFISCANDQEFENKKKNYEKNMTIPTGARETKSIDGEVRVSISKEKETYLDNIKDNIDIDTKIMSQLTKAYKSLVTLMKEASEKMKEISELWKKLYESSKSYYETNNTIESYNLMNKIMLSLSDIENKKVDLMNNYVREYFRFVKNEFNSMKELTVKVYNNKEIYHKALDKIMSTKEKLFRQKDVDLWQLEDKNDLNYKSVLLKNKNVAFSKMIPEETKKFNEIKYNYGFYLNSLISEYERLRILNSRRHKDNIQIFAKMLIDIITQFHGGLNEQIYYYQGLKDDEDIVSQHIGCEKCNFNY